MGPLAKLEIIGIPIRTESCEMQDVITTLARAHAKVVTENMESRTEWENEAAALRQRNHLQMFAAHTREKMLFQENKVQEETVLRADRASKALMREQASLQLEKESLEETLGYERGELDAVKRTYASWLATFEQNEAAYAQQEAQKHKAVATARLNQTEEQARQELAKQQTQSDDREREFSKMSLVLEQKVTQLQQEKNALTVGENQARHSVKVNRSEERFERCAESLKRSRAELREQEEEAVIARNRERDVLVELAAQGQQAYEVKNALMARCVSVEGELEELKKRSQHPAERSDAASDVATIGSAWEQRFNEVTAKMLGQIEQVEISSQEKHNELVRVAYKAIDAKYATKESPKALQSDESGRSDSEWEKIRKSDSESDPTSRPQKKGVTGDEIPEEKVVPLSGKVRRTAAASSGSGDRLTPETESGVSPEGSPPLGRSAAELRKPKAWKDVDTVKGQRLSEKWFRGLGAKMEPLNTHGTIVVRSANGARLACKLREPLQRIGSEQGVR